MPNRILRESILDSEAVDKLTPQGEVFYRRLMSVVDDFGLFDARPAILKARCFPTKLDSVREADISRWTAECVKAGLIALYSHEAKPYLLYFKLGEPRAKKSKYPQPPSGLRVGAVQPAPATPCAQTQADDSTCAHVRADVPYSSSLSDSLSGSPTPICSEPPKAAASEPAALVFDCVGEPKTWDLTETKLAEYRETFPGIDALAECRKALQWTRDNPTKRKTAKGMTRFLGSWLARAQDRLGPTRREAANPPAPRTSAFDALLKGKQNDQH